MNKLLLFCPISRAVRVQRPVICDRLLLNKSFSTTTCRKFGTTSIRRTEEEEENKNPLNLRELLGNAKQNFYIDVVCSFYKLRLPLIWHRRRRRRKFHFRQQILIQFKMILIFVSYWGNEKLSTFFIDVLSFLSHDFP
jgi:hypothetical protein